MTTPRKSTSIPVRVTDIDLFDHMNNSVYWSVIEDYLSSSPGVLRRRCG